MGPDWGWSWLLCWVGWCEHGSSRSDGRRRNRLDAPVCLLLGQRERARERHEARRDGSDAKDEVSRVKVSLHRGPLDRFCIHYRQNILTRRSQEVKERPNVWDYAPPTPMGEAVLAIDGLE